MSSLLANPDFQLVFWSLVKIVVILNGVLGVVSYMICAERKICGRMQGALRPEPRRAVRAAPADRRRRSSCFFKEEFIPGEANKVIFHIAPMLAVIPALVTFSVIPIGPEPFLVTDINVGLLLFLAMSSLGVYAITLGGWSSNNKYALLGGLRSSAQMISYELAMGLSTIGVLLLAGSLSLVDIVHAQASTIAGSSLVQQPRRRS